MNDERKSNDTDLRALILDTARHVLTSEGYHNLSMRRIAGRIGYSATSIYLHFENRDQLVHALIDQGVNMLHDALSGVADRPESASGENATIVRLQRLCRTYIRFGLENPEYYEIMYILHPEYMARYPADKYRKARRNLMLLADTLKEGMESGLFEPSDPLRAATVVWAQLHGIVSLLNSRRVDLRVDKEALIEEACQRIIRGFFAAGERPESPAVPHDEGVEQ
ncbi:MAG: TetR/AcrR family transcriptional regulator [Rhodothermales bacterium]|nr:TetR/AcrR family transcriptional regulator [Rhodothermales bacterium]